ncbi:MAG: rod shape-determining protein RodA [Mariprofundaceae bacterium]|nr:rod shape-determining protein RodA [Mariprofundaceae bacterium]
MMSVLRRVDFIFLLLLLAMACIGLFTLYAAVHQGDTSLWWKQCVFWAVGLSCFFILCFIPTRFIAMMSWPFYLLALFFLALVPFVGDIHMGARRWLDLGPVNMQPSEMMKWALVLMFAHWFASRDAGNWRSLLIALILAAIPAGLIVIQPDLGTALVILFTGSAIILAAGLPWGWLLATLGTSPFLVYVLWLNMHAYQQRRVLSFFDPHNDPLGAGYHVIQSTIAIGSGGLFGKGYMEGTQARLHFLPEQHTDFIFAVLAEEGGLLAVGVLLLCYTLLVARILFIARRARTRFASMLCVGVASIFVLYIGINIGMVSGALPVVGVPLPFVSYGGSALLTMVAALGLVMRVSIESTDKIPWQRPSNPIA